ncbi:ParA family protein [Mucilaginibacter robiniae]|uniref:ParA family protein n=1 Tax=Mucilaginibacter robiniae TaxID=2728022 RepID=UPI002006EAC3|nr:ParA family protein [Mucilaginibacter robiniae]
MIILFANQKGGVGKSTLAVLFANYLSLVQNKEVVIFDMDNQRSIYNKVQASKVLENNPLYEVEAAEMEQFSTIKEIVKEKEGLITILDVAGNIENDTLIPIFQGVDLIICPFSYDEFSVGATIDFSEVVKQLNDQAKIVFIPNRIKTTVKYETLESVNNVFSNFGAITKPLPERIDFQRISTFETPPVSFK